MTSFTERVLKVVRRIPRGKTLSYTEVARRAGSPRAYRAVGNILNRYDSAKFKVPCHRVIRSDLSAPRPGQYFVYAIHCGNDAIYIGQTTDLQKRWRQHCNGTASNFTRRYGAKKIIHYERFDSREKVVQREKWLKTGFGRKWLKREWRAGRTRQAGGTIGGYRWGRKRKENILVSEGVVLSYLSHDREIR
ncbi:MAG: methylated-DNA--[protein]-cysteine S-methyltransferase [Candidatus Liptonbacteria bacterium]|nr:methylated-DNA--[protein]-cysteine S-methyltransferase [Candidatus Liptonbacteria bacterium]